MKLYFQGDLCIEPVADAPLSDARSVPAAQDGAIVLAEGEATGHRHAFYGGEVALFRDDSLARDLPPGLYVGHLRVKSDNAALRHEEHDTIALPRGLYRVRRQREFDGDDALDMRVDMVGRVIAD